MIAVGVDIDEVLSDFVRGFNVKCNAVHGTSFPLDYTDSNWDMAEGRGMTQAQIDQVWDDINTDPHFWRELEALPGVPRALYLLADMQARNLLRVVFITARPLGTNTIAQTQSWLSAKGFIGPKVVFAHDKGAVAKQLALTHFVDDKPENCQMVKEAVPACQVFMASAAHNAGREIEGVERIADFQTFVSRLLTEV